MKKDGKTRALEELREYDPYKPRAVMDRLNYSIRHHKKSEAEIEKIFGPDPYDKAVKDTVKSLKLSRDNHVLDAAPYAKASKPKKRFKRVGLFYVPVEEK